MSKGFGLAVAAGLASALVFLSVMTGGGVGILLAYLMPLPLVLIGVSRGHWPALAAGATASAVVGAMTPGGLPVFLVAALLPTATLVILGLREGQGFRPGETGRFLAGLAAVAVAILVVATLVATSRGSLIEDQARAYVAQVLDQIAPQVPSEMRGSVAALWSALFPAMLGSAWLLMTAANGVLAQWIASRAGQALRTTPVYGSVELPWWMPAALAAALAIGFGAGGDVGYLARNAAVVLVLPQTLAGLAVVHGAMRGRPHGGILLALFYVVFFVMFGWSLVAVAGLGLVRHWTRLRRRQVESGPEEK
jgi:hypothetical protein